MGRYLSFYIVEQDIEHQKIHDNVCFDLEYQLDNEELIDTIEKKLVHNNTSAQDKRKHIENEYIGNINKHNLCPKCKMFMIGICGDVTVDSLHIRHSYSNPIWSSDYNIKDLSLGTSRSEFVRLFRTDSSYFEIFAHHIERGYAYINDLGTPRTETDKEAFDETIRILHFLERWVNNEKVHVILEDDY